MTISNANPMDNSHAGAPVQTSAEAKQQVHRADMVDDRPLPPTVFHYTNAAGLLGILDSRSFWATDLAYLNDSSEFKYGVGQLADLMLEVLTARVDEASNDWTTKTELRPGLEKLATMGLPMSFEVVREYLLYGVTCFCEDGDLLSQWRGYGVGGYSIGFDAEQLRASLKIETVPLYPVAYDIRPNRDRIRQFLDAKLTDIWGASVPVSDIFTHSLGAMAVDVLSFASQIKHESFREEREWLICDMEKVPSKKARFRHGGLGVVPYLEIDLTNTEDPVLPISEIVIGPGPEPHLRAEGVKTLLRHRGYDVSNIYIRPSAIPFRVV